MPAGRLLAELSDDAGYGRADVALLSGLEESTVGRLWNDPDWSDRLSGRSLRALIAALPGVDSHVTRRALSVRQEELVAGLHAQGLRLDSSQLQRGSTSDSTCAQYLLHALDVAGQLAQGNWRSATRRLARFWGRPQDEALALLFDPNFGLFENSTLLIDAVMEAGEWLARQQGSFHAAMGHAALSHHMARARGLALAGGTSAGIRSDALANRSRTIGLIIGRGDLDQLERYAAVVSTDPVQAMVEDWSFPTYSGDLVANKDFLMPRSLLLTRTSLEVLRELHEYNDPYFAYLVRVYLPRALSRDNTFGGQVDELKGALVSRAERCEDQRIREEARRLFRTLADRSSKPTGGTTR